MNIRPALLAAAALGVASWVCLALCPWGGVGNGDLGTLAQEVRRGGELEDHLEGVRRRCQAKRALAAGVVAGRMSLREAAGQFRRLDEESPGDLPDLPGPPGDERALRGAVLGYVWEVLAHQGRFAAAARCYAEAFTADPHWLAGRPSGHRYNAACAAARAGCGQGRDAADLDEASRAALRGQALGWLRADLEARRQLLEKGRPALSLDLHAWLQDPDLAGVRGPDALAELPTAERQAWQKLWADVADTLTRARKAIALEKKLAVPSAAGRSRDAARPVVASGKG